PAPRGADGGSARSVEQTKLDSDRVRDFAHDATESVHFAHQVPLSDAANGGITRHLRDQINVQGIKSGLQPHTSGRQGGLASGMSSTHHHYFEMFIKRPHVRLFGTHNYGRNTALANCNNVLGGGCSLAFVRQ